MATLLSFLFFTALVGILTYVFTRKTDSTSRDGFFLAGRSLTFPLIAGSLLLTNLSTEQMVGLNGLAFEEGLAVMVWEVLAVVALVAMALFFLPRFLKHGVATVPEFLGLRFDRSTAAITNLIFLSAYALILLPIILYTGARGMTEIFDVSGALNISETAALWLVVVAVGIIGSIYALGGGLRSVAVSDTLNGLGLLVGGFLVAWFAFAALGDGSVLQGIGRLGEAAPGKLNAVGGAESSVPIGTLFSGVLLLNLFYWCTNQQIIQRTFGASSLAEGQKGVLLTGALKLLGPIYLVLPGILAYALFADEIASNDQAYGILVNRVLPKALVGFFAAALLGAILSSFNSALNSACTLYSLGIYKEKLKPDASDHQVVRAGRIIGILLAVAAMVGAPFLAQTDAIFVYLQKMNGIYFVPIFSVVFLAMVFPQMTPKAAKAGLLTGLVIIATGYFVWPFNLIVSQVHEFHFLGLTFLWLIVMMLIISNLQASPKPWKTPDTDVIDMTPWKHARLAAGLLLAIVLAIYVLFSDFSILT